MSSKGNLNKVTKFFMEKLKINANVERLFFFVLTFLLMNHLCACFWYFMAKIEDFSPDSWVVRLGYIDSSNIELYIISFYWTLTTVTTVGYGDITAGTTIERIYNLFIMSFGVLLYSFAIGSLSSIVSTLDQKSEEMNQKLQILSSIKKEFNLEQNIYDKVRKVIKYDLSRNQKDKMVFLQELPNKLRIELSQIMHDKVIQNFYFFRDQPSDFFAYVAPLLKPVKFSQNDYLYKCQDMIDEMYFVAKGTVIFCLEKRYGEKEIREIKKNNNFGEIEMCLNEKLSFNIKIKSRNCELFVLKKNDFLRLSVNFKEFIESFLHKSLMKYLKFNEEKNKMMKEFDSLINADEGEEGEEENEDSEEEDEEGEEEEENENEEKALESIDEEGGSSSEGGSESENEDKDKNGDGDEGSDKDKNNSNESGDEKESKNDESKSKSNESESSGSSSQSKSENNSNKNNESKDKNSKNDEDDDSSFRAPDGQGIVRLNKADEDD
jgi:CRP-like cAMP-binding protein